MIAGRSSLAVFHRGSFVTPKYSWTTMFRMARISAHGISGSSVVRRGTGPGIRRSGRREWHRARRRRPWPPPDLTVDEATRLLHVNRKTFDDAVRAGEVPAWSVRGARSASVDALLRWMEGNGSPLRSETDDERRLRSGRLPPGAREYSEARDNISRFKIRARCRRGTCGAHGES